MRGELANIPEESLVGFSERQKQMILARRETRLIDVDSDTYIETMVKIVQTTFFEFGRRNPITKEEIQAQKQDDYALTTILCQDLKRDFKNFSLLDIKTCFAMGVRHEFSDKITGLNIRMFYSWLKKYKELMKKANQAHVLKLNEANKGDQRRVPYHKRPMEELQVVFDMVTDYVFEHNILPLVADWLAVYWFLYNSDKVNLNAAKRKKLFEQYHKKYLERIHNKNRGVKPIGEYLETLDNEAPEYSNGQRQCYAKFHFLELMKKEAKN